MAKIVFKSSQDGINQLPEIMEYLHTILHRSQDNYDVNISVSISKIASKCHKKILSDSSTSSMTTSSIEVKVPKKINKKNNKITSTSGISSILQQTSGGYVDLAKLRDSDNEKQNFEKVSRSLISNRPHRK